MSRAYGGKTLNNNNAACNIMNACESRGLSYYIISGCGCESSRLRRRIHGPRVKSPGKFITNTKSYVVGNQTRWIEFLYPYMRWTSIVPHLLGRSRNYRYLERIELSGKKNNKNQF